MEAWERFSRPFEGRVPHMYCDVLGLITTGVGNLIDPVDAALPLPWKHPDGSLASVAEVRAEWQAVKAQAEYLRKRHYKYAGQMTKLRLTDADIEALVARKLKQNEFVLARTFPAWDLWCADAQLGVSSMAWAMGPAFTAKFKNFTRYALANDWTAASVACKISSVVHQKMPDGSVRDVPNPGTIPRNRANELCFQNAATVMEHGLDPERLWWPDVATPVPPTDTGADPPRVTALAAETARQSYEETEDERRRARDAAIKTIAEGAEDNGNGNGNIA